ncbi:MAG: homoserine kinase [Acidimicrobiales bacterium]
MKARAPGSTSNIGPGYDVLGLALDLYVEVDVEPAATLTIAASGEGSDLPLDHSHLAATVCRAVLGHDSVAIRIWSEIPVGRGLGSSAALAAATAAAAGAHDPLATAAVIDGHAENAAASVLGGLVAASMVGGVATARRLPLDPALAFVAVVPDRQLLTRTARSVLPATVSLADAVHNLGRLGLLLAGLGDGRGLIAAAGEDRLHQPYRTPLWPESTDLMESLLEAGAAIACWSGAGSTILAICTASEAVPVVAAAGERALQDLDVPGRVLRLRADLAGLAVTG